MKTGPQAHRNLTPRFLQRQWLSVPQIGVRGDLVERNYREKRESTVFAAKESPLKHLLTLPGLGGTCGVRSRGLHCPPGGSGIQRLNDDFSLGQEGDAPSAFSGFVTVARSDKWHA